MTRTERVTARLRPDAYRVVELAADARGETISTWVARAVERQSYRELLEDDEGPDGEA